MTAEQQRQLDLIEKDRVERERELLLLFLLLSDTARSYAMYAVKLGHDPVAAVRNVFLGNPDLDLRGGIDGTAIAMQEAYVGANQTAADIVGAEAMPVTAPRYTDAAREAIDRMIRPLTSKIRQAQEMARAQGMGAKATAAEVGSVFGDNGFSKDNNEILDAVAITLVNSAFQPGLYRGFKNSGVVNGLEYVSVLDERTCFVAGTMVQLADGSHQSIETIRAGQFIQSGSGRSRRIAGTKIASCRSLVRIGYSNGSQTVSTLTHPFWAIRDGNFCWVEGKEMSAGDIVGVGSLQPLRENSTVLWRGTKEVLQSGMLPEKQRKDLAGKHLPELRSEFQGKDLLHAKRGKRRKVLFAKMQEAIWDEGTVCFSDYLQLRKMRKAIPSSPLAYLEETIDTLLLQSLPAAESNSSMPIMRERHGVHDSLGHAILFSGMLSKIEIGNQNRKGGSRGTGMDWTALRARGEGGKIFRRFHCGRESGNRSGRDILARQAESKSERQEEGFAFEEERIPSDSHPGAANPKVENGTHACADHGVLPVVASEVTVVDVEIIELENPVQVFDLEVEQDHSYLVGGGIIAHNTTICLARAGVKLPIDDPWWDGHSAPAHWRCRATIIPIVGAFQKTENPPMIPSQSGFGMRSLFVAI